VRAKIVTSPWVAEVFEIGGPFFAFVQHLYLIGQTDDRTSTAHLSPHFWIDYVLKLQGNTSMFNLIEMP